MLLHVLKQGAASPVDDALGHAGGAGGIENVQRMIEGKRLELECLVLAQEAVPGLRPGDVSDVGFRIEERHHHDLLDTIQFFENVPDAL